MSLLATSRQLKDLARECTVKIPANGVAGGSGFFVAPGIIVSCAHVVAMEGGTAKTVKIEWHEARHTGQVTAVPPNHESNDLWPYPDLCVIELDDPPPEHPWADLGAIDYRRSRELYLAGYNDVYSPGTARCGAKHGWLDEFQEIAGGEALQIRDCEMAPGMSGGPVLQVHSGVVCGIAKTSRMPDTPMGGLMIPATAIRECFSDVWERIQQTGQDNSRWAMLRDETLADGSLVEKSRRTLLEAQQQLGLQHRDFYALWQEIAGPLGPPPPGLMEDVLDLADALTDLPREPLHPVAQLFLLLSSWHEDQLRGTLRQYGENLALQNGQRAGLREFPVRDLSDRSAEAPPVILVRLTPGLDPVREVELRMWRYPAGTGPALPVSCDPGPHLATDIERVITSVLAREIPEISLDKQPLIEFALPDHLLDVAVEGWQVAEIPDGDTYTLGVEYCVVVRFAARNQRQLQAWREHKNEFRNGKMPPRSSSCWDDLWIACEDMRDSAQLIGKLKSNGNAVPSLVAMTAWHHSAPVPPGIAAARRAGTPVIVWQHQPCVDHGEGNKAAGSCRGQRFKEAVVRHLADVPFDQLPGKVQQERAAATAGAREYPGQSIAILWDDPCRLPPWADAQRYQAPRN